MIYLVLIPLGIAFLPWLLVRYVFVAKQTRHLPYGLYAPYLWLASFLWITAFFVPNIPISTETSTFGQHFVGGIVAAVLFAYTIKVYQVTFRYWWQAVLALYFFVSGLGVANELFELLATASGYIWIDGADVWWDLLANTVGAFSAAGLWRAAHLAISRR